MKTKVWKPLTLVTKNRINRASPMFKPKPKPPPLTSFQIPLKNLGDASASQVATVTHPSQQMFLPMTKVSNLKALMRQVTRKTNPKADGQNLVFLEWIGCEDLVNNYADWVQESWYSGPVFAFDSFERRTSMMLSAPRPDNHPAPEPSGRLRVQKGFHNVPEPISVLYVGENTPSQLAADLVSRMVPGSIIVTPWKSIPVDRDAIPLLHCRTEVAMQLT